MSDEQAVVSSRQLAEKQFQFAIGVISNKIGVIVPAIHEIQAKTLFLRIDGEHT